MKVLLINGSPNKAGCTYTALEEIAAELRDESVETEIFQVGDQIVAGCTGCGVCHLSQPGLCVKNDVVNEVIKKLQAVDGLVIGSPVYFASANGTLISFLDRLFYAARSELSYKPGAAIVSARRGGTTASLDQLNKYFTINNMPLVSSKYWNQVHGNTPAEVRKDEEGMQIMRGVGRNMAWLLKCLAAGKAVGIDKPQEEVPQRTNFIR